MKLPQKMSEALTNTMIEANIIKKEEHDIYSYCYEFLFENIVYIASIILFGALLHNLKETLIFCPTRRFSFWNALRSAWWHQLTVPQRKWPTNIVKGIKKYVSFVVYWWSCYNSFSILTDTISFVIFYFFVVCCLYWMFPLLFLSSPYIIQKAVDK